MLLSWARHLPGEPDGVNSEDGGGDGVCNSDDLTSVLVSLRRVPQPVVVVNKDHDSVEHQVQGCPHEDEEDGQLEVLTKGEVLGD